MKLINAKDFYEKLKDKNSVLIDIREVDEYKEGHLKGAENIPMGSIPFKLGYLEKLLSEGKDILIYCHSGARSRNLSLWLNAREISVYDLAGGIASWPFEIER